MPLPEAERLFRDFRNEKDKVKSAQILGELLDNHVKPLIKPILWRGLQSGNCSKETIETEVEELSSEIVISFINRFNDKNETIPPNIENIEAYFKQTANLRIKDFWRKQNPNWFSLKNKVFYLFDKKNQYSPKAFVFLKDEKLFTLRKYGTTKSKYNREKLEEIFKETDLINPQTELIEAITNALKTAQGGLSASILVNLVFDLQNITAEMSEIPIEETIHSIANKTFGDDEQLRLEARIRLGKIWLEIKELPFNQRFALLLQMQEKGLSGVHLMIFLQVVKFKELAESLAMSVNELAELYNDLPLSDNQIAILLTAKLRQTNPNSEDITPKQIANLRKVARERLQRKVKLFDE